jgi:hypothetical protein
MGLSLLDSEYTTGGRGRGDAEVASAGGEAGQGQFEEVAAGKDFGHLFSFVSVAIEH